MKKIILLILFVLFISINFISSQSCLPSGIVFQTQNEIDNFQTDYPGCSEIEGYVRVEGQDITNLDGLSVITSIGGDYLDIANNPVLTDLNGLANLIAVSGTIMLVDNPSLTSLSGLANLSSAGDIEIRNNPVLSSFYGLEGITTIEGFIRLEYNPLPTNLNGFNGLITVGEHLEIVENANLINLIGLEELVTVNGELIVAQNDALISLEGLNSLSSVGSGLIFSGNISLNNCESLNQLSTVGGVLQFNKNYSITSLSGLELLTTIGSYLLINENIELINLNGLNNLTTIGGKLHIRKNYKLENISVLTSINTIDGLLLIDDNSELTSLIGIENINPNTIDSISIINNLVLSTCEVQSVCDFLSSSITSVNIHDNALGCNSKNEVELACLAGIVNNASEFKIVIHPNPALDNIHIINEKGIKLDEISIYNTFGQRALNVTEVIDIIDVSNLEAGFYIIEIVADKRKLNKKLIIQ